MPFLKSAPLLAIKAVTTVSSLWAVNKVEKIVDDYASTIGFTAGTKPTPKDFFELVSKASDILRATQKPEHVAKFYVAMFHKMYDMRPQKMFEAFLNNAYQDDLVHELYDFAHKNQDNKDILDRSFKAFLAIGTSKAYDCALALSGKNDEDANTLIDKIMQPGIDNQASLLTYCLQVNTSRDIEKKVFAAFCELSKSTDKQVAEYAQDKVVEMLYKWEEGLGYVNIAELAPVLEQIAKKEESPAALMPLFKKVTHPQKELKQYIKESLTLPTPDNSGKPGVAMGLKGTFERIDTNNIAKGFPTPFAGVYNEAQEVEEGKRRVVHNHERSFSGF